MLKVNTERDEKKLEFYVNITLRGTMYFVKL